ncbi:hypothetical protein M8J77_008056 [Diaphorina citri]|nr:hypothetical protein M8J77_008056 [Diaphorina citri]
MFAIVPGQGVDFGSDVADIDWSNEKSPVKMNQEARRQYVHTSYESPVKMAKNNGRTRTENKKTTRNMKD